MSTRLPPDGGSSEAARLKTSENNRPPAALPKGRRDRFRGASKSTVMLGEGGYFLDARTYEEILQQARKISHD